MKKEDVERLTAYSRLAKRELTPTLKGTCVRIMRRTTEAQDFCPEASASLFSIAGLHFLVTAGHVLDDGNDLWVENDFTSKRMTLAGRRWRNSVLDLGFVELPDKMVTGLQGMRFIRMEQVQLQIPQQSILAITGYPQELNVGAKYALGYFGVPVTDRPVGVECDPEVHFLLRYDMSFSAGEDGTPLGLPDTLKGMSGCPVWWFDPFKPLDVASMRLVGLQSSTIPVPGEPYVRLVKGVRWTSVLSSMVQAYPDLEGALALHRVAVRG